LTEPSSTEITPSSPTVRSVCATIRPIDSSSLAEIAATRRMVGKGIDEVLAGPLKHGRARVLAGMVRWLDQIQQVLRELSERKGIAPHRVSPEVMRRLAAYRWPGNVREMQNAVQRAVLLCRNNRICSSDLPAKIGGLELADFSANQAFARRPTLEQLESDYIQFVLASVGGNRSEAAGILGIDRKTLYRKLEASGQPFWLFRRRSERDRQLCASDALSTKTP